MSSNRWLRILGVAFVMYVFAHIDRANLAMAAPFVRAELGFTPAALGFATGLFFWGYIILQIPAGRLAAVWSPKKVLLAQMLAWSVISLSTALVHTQTQLGINRFALGLAEGGVLTCTLVLIRNWFTQAERARANALFLMSLPIGPLVANPVSGLILTHASWRWMFVIEAIPGILWMLVWVWAIADRPEEADWLDPQERAELVARLEAEKAKIAPATGHWLKTLWHPAVLMLALYNFLALMAEWGVGFWLPTVLKESGFSIGVVGLLAALPSLLGIVSMQAVAASSDRRRERKWHMIGATAVSGLALLILPFAGGSTVAMVACLTIGIAAFLGRFGPFWTLPSEVLPASVVGVGIGLINGAGNLGGTVGPWFFGAVKTHTGSFSLALTVAGVSLILSSLAAAPIRTRQAPPR
ncbi:MAG: MFS transporter [Hyphomicrobiales bacterium]|nr:MFS transporter [Hyphomicrobiales bacterium]